MSFKAEVIADASGKWVSNLMRFATYAEAQSYAADLARRWTQVRQTAVAESDDPVNARVVNGRVEYVPEYTGVSG